MQIIDMSKNNNLGDFCKDIANAIREKKGTSEPINAQNFAEEIRTIESGGSGWTGHADVEGLKAIGWDGEDIAYYQKHGVNWNEEDDEYHKVSDDNKALYGVLTANNIQDYKDRIVYLPKIDFSGVTNGANLFDRCYSLIALPMIDTSHFTTAYAMFNRCYALTCVPKLDFKNVTSCGDMFYLCVALHYLPTIELTNATNISAMFNQCHSLTNICLTNTQKITLITGIFPNCRSLVNIEDLDANKASFNNIAFQEATCLIKANIKNLNSHLFLNWSSSISKQSLLYIINNEAATSAITITLHSYAYQRLAEDTDIVEALNNHPLVSLASA